MKKILLFISVIMMAVVLTGCGAKKAITAADFASALRKQGFSVENYTNMVEDKNIETLLAAEKSSFGLEFHKYKTEDAAKTAFKGNKKEFSQSKKKDSVEKSVETNNYEKYTLQLSDRYNVVIRNGNTLLYASINLQYKKDLDKIIKNIGY